MTAPNFRNRTLYHGDNLEFLRGMDSETVDLIATDPPFKKGRDFHATPDSLAAAAKFEDRWSWDKDVHPDWVDAIKDDWPAVWQVIEAARAASGSDMAAFLCWLGVRLMECRRVLKPTGSLYLHIDHTAHAYVKALMDAVFGKDNFRNEIIWKRTARGFKGSQFQPRSYNSNTDIILFYGKTANAAFDMSRVLEPYDPDYVAKAFTFEDDKGRYYLDVAYNRPSASPRPNLCYGYRGFFPPHPSGWKVGMARMEELDNDGELVVQDDRLYRKVRPKAGRIRNTLWDDVSEAKGKERSGYPTQKPLALYERIIAASSNPGDMVLDPFCGCATTPIAAERLGRQWIGMDIWDGAVGIVKQRMEDNRQLLSDPDPQIHYSTAPPVRTDAGQDAAPSLRLKVQIPEPPGPKMTHAEMKEALIGNEGLVCKGCLRTFDDPRYLDLDHNTPRSDGGLNHISNRLLLCGPCNRAKSNPESTEGMGIEGVLNG